MPNILRHENPSAATGNAARSPAAEVAGWGKTNPAAPVDLIRLTTAGAAYLRAVYLLQEEGSPVATQQIARALNVSSPSATNMIKRLHQLGLLRHARYHGVALTEAGERVALRATRRHRLLELYLVEALGYRWDEVHAEAEMLAYYVSENLADRLEAVLGFPTFDPHGHPIPSAQGALAPVTDISLLDLEPGATAAVRSIADRNPAQLRYLAELGLAPGVTVSMIEILPFEGPVRIRIGAHEHVLTRRLATAVSIERLEAE